MAKKKIALIGGGQIGGIMALMCAQKEMGDVVMYDILDGMPQGKCLDIAEGRPINGFDVNLKGTNDWADLEGSDVVMITAGVPRKPGMTRDDLLNVNLDIVKTVAPNVKKYCPNAFVIILSNPLDVMVYSFHKLTNWPKNMICGMAGVLDSTRFRSFVAMETGFSVKDVSALVLGGHGPTMVPLVRYANINGLPIELFLSQEQISAIVKRTQEAGTEIVKLLKTGSAFFSPAESAVQMANAYLKDHKRLLACAALCEGEYGVKGQFVGVPVIMGAGGIEKIIELELNADEKAMMDKSIDHVIKVTEQVTL